MPQISRVSGRATSIYTEDGYTITRYHSTEVVKFNEHEIILHSGGWRTSTTKNRMNQASNQFGLGYTVRQTDFEWYVDYNGKTYTFYDGIILDRQGGER